MLSKKKQKNYVILIKNKMRENKEAKTTYINLNSKQQKKSPFHPGNRQST